MAVSKDIAMARSVLDAPHLHSEEAAFEYIERLIWPKWTCLPFLQQEDRKDLRE
jgi:hypothetical protein